MDARGNITWMVLGNGVETFAVYNEQSGHIEKLEAYDANGAELQEVDYIFDLYGTLRQRHDRSAGEDLSEDLSYDSLNRLVRVELTAPGHQIATPLETLALNYDAIGNITFKSDVGQYHYGGGNAGPHAVTSAGYDVFAYDLKGNQVSGAGRNITYSVFDKPISIRKGGQSTEFIYGIGQQRIARLDANEIDGEKLTHYLGDVEFIETDGSARFKRHISSVAVADFYPGTGAVSLNYLVRDHLGSPHNLTDESGTIESAIWLNFDAFGQRRDGSWQALLDDFSTTTLGRISTRGFTGHEQLDAMGIIHMNGRIYDPGLGRFLQADPFIQAPENGQSLNRYSYVLNSPVSYTDPSGYFSLKRFFKRWGRTIVSIAAGYFTYGAAAGWAFGFMPSVALGVASAGAYTASAVVGGAASGFVMGAISGGGVRGAVAGAFLGAAFAYVGEQISTGIRNWRNGRGELWRVEYHGNIDDFLTEHISDPTSVQVDQLFVNGQSNKIDKAVKLGFEQLGRPAEFFVFHNPTHGVIADTVESALGKVFNTSSISRQLSELLSGQAQSLINITAHSQGAIIVSNALRQMAPGTLTTNTVVNFNGAAVGPKIFAKTVQGAGASPGIYQAHTFDAVPNLIGMATWNPIKILGSVLVSPLLLTSLSPHTFYSP
jgi:RHS repeat-associated protein